MDEQFQVSPEMFQAAVMQRRIGLPASSSGNDPNQDLEKWDRRLPYNEVQGGRIASNLVNAWMGTGLPPSHPREMVTWGDQDEEYNLKGAARPEYPDRIGVQAKHLAALIGMGGDYPRAMGTLANELTHYHQYRYARDRQTRMQNREKMEPWRNLAAGMLPRQSGNPDWEEINRRRHAGLYDDSPWIASINDQGDASRIDSGEELESTMMGAAMRNYIQAKMEEDYANQQAPGIKPR